MRRVTSFDDPGFFDEHWADIYDVGPERAERCQPGRRG
jgi:hypothetical protein